MHRNIWPLRGEITLLQMYIIPNLYRGNYHRAVDKFRDRSAGRRRGRRRGDDDELEMDTNLRAIFHPCI